MCCQGYCRPHYRVCRHRGRWGKGHHWWALGQATLHGDVTKAGGLVRSYFHVSFTPMGLMSEISHLPIAAPSPLL